MATVLWVDDEIDHLQSHIRFLEKRNYTILTAGGGLQALEILSKNQIDIVLMDQMMVGMDGLETVSKIREKNQTIPIVMVTQSEEEELMDRAIGGDADDYLTKPVNPSQILLVLKRLLTGDKLRMQRASEELSSQVLKVLELQEEEMSRENWTDIYQLWTQNDIAANNGITTGMTSHQSSRLGSLTLTFSKYVETEYTKWIADTSDSAPIMPHNYLERMVIPELERSGDVVLIVMDCMRYDQWLMMSPFLEKWFDIDMNFMFSLLPSATPYSRNALFAGLLPRDIARFYRQKWTEGYGIQGLNRHEEYFIGEALNRLGWNRGGTPAFAKVSTSREGENVVNSLSRLMQNGFLAIVINYIDHLTHGRSELDLIRDLAPDVMSFRKLAETWFVSSFLKRLFHTLAARGATVLVTSDHGSVFTTKQTAISGGRGMSGSLRYRFGHSLYVDPKTAVTIKNPADWGLPDDSPSKSYVFARSDYFLMRKGVPRYDLEKFKHTFQHGGISLEEMIVPNVILRPKKTH